MLASILVVPVSHHRNADRARARWLIYIASGSVPLGFYPIARRPPARGDTVVVNPSATIASLLVRHSLLPAGALFLKRITGDPGDDIRRSEGGVRVNRNAGRGGPSTMVATANAARLGGVPEALRRAILRGPTPSLFLRQPVLRNDLRGQIVGVASPLWTWNPSE